ncbi:MAG TPA: hypothetical protein VHQ90_24725 [Thermoanaerobaculia bacterium]|nr:hypothetical protein [Thermoanaerobaculia bacterium]
MRRLSLLKLAAALGLLAAALAPARGTGSCICPQYYDPVTCSNGFTYSNLCYAQCAGATGCVPCCTS